MNGKKEALIVGKRQKSKGRTNGNKYSCAGLFRSKEYFFPITHQPILVYFCLYDYIMAGNHYFYWPWSEGDNALVSVRPSVCQDSRIWPHKPFQGCRSSGGVRALMVWENWCNHVHYLPASLSYVVDETPLWTILLPNVFLFFFFFWWTGLVRQWQDSVLHFILWFYPKVPWT